MKTQKNKGINKWNKDSDNVTPTKLASELKVYTAYLVFCRIHWDSATNEFMREANILFCSNAFEPGKLLTNILLRSFSIYIVPLSLVNGSVHIDEKKYSSNNLQIAKLLCTLVSSTKNTTEFNLEVSCTVSYNCCCLAFKYKLYFEKIPDMYKCTELRNKYLQVKILIGNGQESAMHPIFKFKCDQGVTDSIFFPVNQYAPT